MTDFAASDSLTTLSASLFCASNFSFSALAAARPRTASASALASFDPAGAAG